MFYSLFNFKFNFSLEWIAAKVVFADIIYMLALQFSRTSSVITSII